MNIHEHQAKEILKEYGAPVSNGVVIFSKNEIKEKISLLKVSEFVLKAQIQSFPNQKLTKGINHNSILQCMLVKRSSLIQK